MRINNMLSNMTPVQLAIISLLALQLPEGKCQCFQDPNCTGTLNVPNQSSLKDCCVNTDDGLSYKSGDGTCTDCIVHGFDATEVKISEDAVATIRVFRLFVKGNTTGISPTRTTLPGIISSVPDTAKDGQDYVLPEVSTASLPMEWQVNIVDDDIALEYRDRLTVVYLPQSPAVITDFEEDNQFIRSTILVYIEDNDRLDINFNEIDYSTSENDIMGLSGISLSFRLTQEPFRLELIPATVDMAIRDYEISGLDLNNIESDKRATLGADFIATPFVVEIPAGTTSLNIPNITIIDDNLNEKEEMFLLVARILGKAALNNASCFQITQGDTCNNHGHIGGTRLRIRDDDDMYIGFTRRNLVVRENENPDTSHTINLVNISSFRQSEIETRVVVSVGAHNATVRQYLDAFVDATFGSRSPKTNVLNSEHLLPSYNQNMSVAYLLQNDITPEETEFFTLRITPADLGGGVRRNFKCYHNNEEPVKGNFFCSLRVTIADEDVNLEVSFDKTLYFVNENDGSVEICVNLTAPDYDIFENEVRVEVFENDTVKRNEYIPDDAILASGILRNADYEKQELGLSAIREEIITELSRTVCYNQTIYDDERLEATEYAGLTLAVQGSPATTALTTVGIQHTALRIIDNDIARVGFDSTLYRVNETSGIVEICAVVMEPNIDCPIDFTFNVTFRTRNGSAVSSMDYQPQEMLLMFEKCDTKSCLNVEIEDNNSPEFVETFMGILKRTENLDNRIILQPNITNIEILDNDAIVGWEETVYTVTESSSVEVCGVTSEVLSRTVTALIRSQDGTAVGTVNYERIDKALGPFFQPGQRVCFNISIPDNSDCTEPSLNYTIVMSQQDMLEDGVTINVPVTTIVIDDSNEIECINVVVGYEQTVYTTSEEAGVVELCAVTSSHPSGSPRSFTLLATTTDDTAAAGSDYKSISSFGLVFETGDSRKCHSIIINGDQFFEQPPERFYANLTLGKGGSGVTLKPSGAAVLIFDSSVFVNDTVIGDPLMTVPILQDKASSGGDHTSLCYELHGEADTFFSLISDGCTAVNAHYVKADINTTDFELNVVDAIGVRAVGNDGTCRNIGVGLNGCQARVNGIDIAGTYQMGGISVREYNSRVRISVPNCADSSLVMWVFCMEATTRDDVTFEIFRFPMIRFVVARGLNLNEQSHGIIGQFWNIPIQIKKYSGKYEGSETSNVYEVTVEYPGSKPRSFVGVLHSHTWELAKRPCLYVGNSQAGPTDEVPTLNDSVIEGYYTDYIIASLFSTNYKYSHFETTRC